MTPYKIFAKDAVMSVGFEPVDGWECLYYHKEKRMFLSIYVDDFRMADLKANMKFLWAELRKKLVAYFAGVQESVTVLCCDKVQATMLKNMGVPKAYTIDTYQGGEDVIVIGIGCRDDFSFSVFAITSFVFCRNF